VYSINPSSFVSASKSGSVVKTDESQLSLNVTPEAGIVKTSTLAPLTGLSFLIS